MTKNNLKAVEDMYVVEYSSDGTISAKFLPEVEIIKDYQFANCSRLVNVEFPTSVRGIGAFSFLGTGIKRIVIPEGVEEIGPQAFAACSHLEEVVLPTTLKRIDDGAFHNSGIKKIVIPEGVEVLDNQVFSYCSKLEEVTLPSTLRRIQAWTFYRSGIKRVVIPEGVEKIEGEAFYECSNLEEVTLPTTLKKIGEQAFCRSGIKRVVIPEGVEEIEGDAFYECSNLEEVSLPTTLKKIGEQAFCRSRIKRIVIPDGIKEIEKLAFDSCSNLEEITMPPTLEEIEGPIFYSNEVKRINISSSLEFNNFCRACNFIYWNDIFRLFYEKDLSDTSLSFIFNYKDSTFLKEFTLSFLSKRKEYFFKDKISKIKKNFSRLNICLIGPNLSSYQKYILRKLFSKVGIESCFFWLEETYATNSLILVDPNFNIEDDEILSRIKKLDVLIANCPDKTKSFIINKRNEFIKEYKESMEKEKPVLDFSKDASLSFGKMEIGFSKIQFLARLDSFIQILSNQTNFSSKLKDYYKILECPPRKMVENPCTNEEILNNLVYLLSLLEENKKEEFIHKIKTILDEMSEYYERGVEERITLHHDFESILRLKLESLYKNALSYYAYYDQAKPYISLKQSFESNSNEQVEAAELLIFNFLESLASIKQQEYANALYTSFEEIKNKYIKIIDYILENEEFQDENYPKIVRQLVKDMEPLLMYMHAIIFQEKKQDNLQIEIQEELKRLQNQETDISGHGALKSIIIDIEKLMKEKQLDDADKEEIKSEIERTLNSFLEELKYPTTPDQIHGIEFELYKEMTRILLTIMTYERDKKRYDKFYSLKKRLIGIVIPRKKK